MFGIKKFHSIINKNKSCILKLSYNQNNNALNFNYTEENNKLIINFNRYLRKLKKKIYIIIIYQKKIMNI